MQQWKEAREEERRASAQAALHARQAKQAEEDAARRARLEVGRARLELHKEVQVGRRGGGCWGRTRGGRGRGGGRVCRWVGGGVREGC